MKKAIVSGMMCLLAVGIGLGLFANPVGAQSTIDARKPAARAQQGLVPPVPMYQPRPWEPVENVPDLSAPFGPTLSLLTTAWTSIGPGPLNSGGSTGNVSGRITGIAAHPTDPLTIYISAAGGGVWKTTNGGGTWTPTTDAQTTVSMGCIAISKTNPLVLYAGTGEANNSLDSNFGRGILTSTDGGATWTLRTGPAGVFNTNRMTCSKIAVDPSNANIAYAAMANLGTNGIFAGGITGIYKTTDGGAVWTNVTAANGKESTYAWSDVAVDPNTPSIIYGAVGYAFGAPNNAVYKSSDSGATWTQLNAANAPVGASFGRLSLAVSTAVNANVLYDDASSPSTYALLRMVRSDDAGTSFNLLSPANYMGGQGWYDQGLIVDPTNSAIVYATGAAGGGMLRSINSGGAWTSIGVGVVSPHVDHHATAFDANGKLLDGDDGGIYRLDDPTVPTWTNLNGNLATIQFQGIGLHPTNANIAIGGSQDNGTEVYSGSLTWTETDLGDGGIAKFNQTNGNVAYHQIPNGSFGSNFFRVSLDGGATWNTQTGSGLAGDVNNQQFYAPYVANGNRVLYGTDKIWETTDATVVGANNVVWTALGAVGTNGWNPSGGFVNAIGLAPSTVNTIYAAAHASGGFGNTNVFVTTDHGTNWTQHNLPVAGQVQDIQVDPTTSTTAYAVVSSFSTGGNVFKTINGGTTWTNISGDLATVTACTCAIPVWSLQIDNAAGKLYIGADDGVYVSSNSGTNWTRFGTGLPNGQVFQIELNKTLNILGAGIHGRGMWEISVGAPTAAGVSVSGRVLTSDGRGLVNARVTIADSNGAVRTVITSPFGYYRFNDVQAGGTYVMGVVSKRFKYAPRVVSVTDNLADVDFTAGTTAPAPASKIKPGSGGVNSGPARDTGRVTISTLTLSCTNAVPKWATGILAPAADCGAVSAKDPDLIR